MLIADADVPDPVVQALQILGYGIVRYAELNIPVRPDKALLEGVLSHQGVVITKDTGIPSQAYLFEYAQTRMVLL